MKSEENNNTTPDSTRFDVAIIGGGIHGAGIAQAAAAAGYSTLLLEKTSWGAGTSSKSSKLIHGGLRYLENGHFRLVRESIKERELLLQLAPELVKRQHFYIPLYHQTRRSNWQLRAGLSLYSMLAGFGKASRFRHYNQQQLSKFSELRQKELSAVYRYSDAQTDDKALTRAVAESAQSLGATLLCPAEVQRAQWHEDSYLIEVETNSERCQFQSSCLINAAGPWVNHIATGIQPPPPTLEIDLVQGAHLVYSKAISEHCYYLEAPQDGRAVFVLPWQEGSLVGTTETLFEGSPDRCEAQPQEVDYLKEVVRHYFPDYSHWQQPNDQFAGLRVLPKARSSLFSRSRETQLVTSGNYLALYGGKLTGYRITAEKVVKCIAKMIGQRNSIANTAELPLEPF